MNTQIALQDPIAMANLIINLAKEHNYSITNLQLQKILFFIQGFSLKNYQQPIMDTQFVKWTYGPAIKDVYGCFRYNGSAPITSEQPNAYFDNNGKFCLEHITVQNLTTLQLKQLKNLISKLLPIPVWKLFNLIKSDSSYVKESEIEQNYTNTEIVDLYKKLITKFNLN